MRLGVIDTCSKCFLVCEHWFTVKLYDLLSSSRVFAVDPSCSIFEKGFSNSGAGRRYRHIVLGAGGSKDEMEILKDLLGKNPNVKAFSKELGIRFSFFLYGVQGRENSMGSLE